MDWNAIKPLLDAKLDPKHVKKGGGSFGPKGDYLEGWFVIQEANRIFGHGGWSYTIDLRQDDLRQATVTKRSRDGKEWQEDQWQAAYTCICTVRVGDVVRQDVGFGSGFAKGVGDAIEGATKESATDALKRCLRTFGSPFGLALYDKTRENVGVDAPPPPSPADRAEKAASWALKEIAAARDVDAFDTLTRSDRYKQAKAVLEASPDLLGRVMTAAAKRFEALAGSPKGDVILGEHNLSDVPGAFQ